MRFVWTTVGLAVVVLAGAAPGQAHAQAAPDKLWVGGGIGISPIGTVKEQATILGVTIDQSADTAAAVQLNGLIEYRVTPMVAIGFAPAVILHAKPGGDGDSGSVLDLPLRVAVGAPVAPKLRLYGFASPGYSVLFPGSDRSNLGHPSGFMIGFGGGAGYHLAPKLTLTGELGYQFRFPSTTVEGQDVSMRLNYLTLAFGVVAAI